MILPCLVNMLLCEIFTELFATSTCLFLVQKMALSSDYEICMHGMLAIDKNKAHFFNKMNVFIKLLLHYAMCIIIIVWHMLIFRVTLANYFNLCLNFFW